MKKVTVIGGGTGTFVVLSGLKNYPYDISAIVATTDSGGSTGRLRDQYGVLPPGDLRQGLVALSEAPDLWRKLFLYRFDGGDFEGHNFGNIFLTALEKISPDYNKVIEMASYILQTKGTILPVTFDKVHLCAEYADGEIIETEDLIDTAFHKKSPIVNAYLKPSAKPNRKALKAIRKAEYIILGPGDMFTSLVPNLLVKRTAQEVAQSKARIIYIVNLMTKRGQTTGFNAKDHVRELEKYMGRKVDIILINNADIPDNIIAYYTQYREKVIKDDLPRRSDYTIIRRDLISTEHFDQKAEDKVMRSILRHDSLKVARALHDIIGTL